MSGSGTEQQAKWRRDGRVGAAMEKNINSTEPTKKLQDLLCEASKWCSGLISSYVHMLFVDSVISIHGRFLTQQATAIVVWKEDIGIPYTKADRVSW